MRADIHPKYEKLVATCSCGNVIETRSALGKETLYLDVCSACHPFYTGKQKNVDRIAFSTFQGCATVLREAAWHHGR